MTQPQWPGRSYPSPASRPDRSINTQVVADYDNPHAQAAFWAAALGYLVEDPHDLVEAVVPAGYAELRRDTVEVNGRPAFRTGMAIKHPDDVDGPRGTGRRILFQAVPDRSPGEEQVAPRPERG
jgi:hypothetical protein